MTDVLTRPCHVQTVACRISDLLTEIDAVKARAGQIGGEQ